MVIGGSPPTMGPERYRLPGDAFELMRYKLEECRKECERWQLASIDRDRLSNELTTAQARIQELEDDMTQYAHSPREKEVTALHARIEKLEQERDELIQSNAVLSDAAQAEIKRLVMELGQAHANRFHITEVNALRAIDQARIKELEQEDARLNNLVDDLCIEAAQLQNDRDNWRAQAESK